MITAPYVFTRPSCDKTMYCGRKVTEAVKRSETTMSDLIIFLPGKSCLANGYAAMLAKNRCPAVPIILTRKLLKRYLDSGTQKDAVICCNSMKLLTVGCLTKSLGGKINISVIGLNAVFTA
ncbi:MAG: hypothetical protein ACYC5K_03320 [Saccharofermentanales bacterium]